MNKSMTIIWAGCIGLAACTAAVDATNGDGSDLTQQGVDLASDAQTCPNPYGSDADPIRQGSGANFRVSEIVVDGLRQIVDADGFYVSNCEGDEVAGTRFCICVGRFSTPNDASAALKLVQPGGEVIGYRCAPREPSPYDKEAVIRRTSSVSKPWSVQYGDYHGTCEEEPVGSAEEPTGTDTDIVCSIDAVGLLRVSGVSSSPEYRLAGLTGDGSLSPLVLTAFMGTEYRCKPITAPPGNSAIADTTTGESN